MHVLIDKLMIDCHTLYAKLYIRWILPGEIYCETITIQWLCSLAILSHGRNCVRDFRSGIDRRWEMTFDRNDVLANREGMTDHKPLPNVPGVNILKPFSEGVCTTCKLSNFLEIVLF